MQKVALGETAAIECISYTEGEWLFMERFIPRNAVPSINVLNIYKVNEYNAGLYECQGSNIHRQIFSALSMLYVIGEE